jgi:hypothetical protein
MYTIPRKSYNAPHKTHNASESPVSGVEQDSLKDGSEPALGELPLRDRDEDVLLELFDQDGIEAIEEDIVRNLQIRCPEPCWEDDSLEFLRDYL